MKVRAAVLEDAPVLGRVMVEAWLSAHRGQMPDWVWQKRVDDEAMGGHELGQRTFDEEGYPLPETVYGWPDLTALIGDSDQRA